jgi:hypothetical protein
VPINPTLPVDGESNWDVSLNAALDIIIDEVNAQETDIAAALTTAAAPELIRDTMGTALVAGANVTITPNDGADTITIAATGGGGGAVDSVNGDTGTVVLTQDDIGDGSTYVQFSAVQETKLAGIATGATANSADATLLARANHTGTQLASTVSDFSTAANTAVRRQATFSQGGTLTTGTGAFRLYNRDGVTHTIHTVTASVGTQPTGDSILVDVNKNGTTIFTTQSNRPTIAVSTNEDESGTPDVTSWAAGDYLTIDIDQIGSTIAGANLTVTVVYS